MIIKNGKIITPNGIEEAEIEIKEGKITKIGKDIQGNETFNAKGMLILPGGVDNHVHIEKDYLAVPTDDSVEKSTLAALYGGTTTVVDFSFLDSFYSRVKKFEGRSYTNFHFHIVTNKYDEKLEKLREEGFTTVKFFTIPYGSLPPGNFDDLLSILEHGFNVMVHAEDWDLISSISKRLGGGDPYLHLISRPEESEFSMTLKLSYLAKFGKGKLLIAHVSSPKTLELEGLMFEGTLHHLFLDSSYYYKDNAYLYVTSPPARTRLIDFIDKFDIIATDHNWFNKTTKEKHRRFPDLVPGLPSIELRVPMILTCFIKNKKSLWKALELLSINPASFNNLKVGQIKEGYNADLVIYDMNEKWVVTPEKLHMADWTPFEGFEIIGKVKHVFLNGELVLEDEEIVKKKKRQGTLLLRN